MEAGQSPLKPSEAAKGRNPDGKTLGDDSVARLGLLDSVDGGGNYDLGVSINVNEGLGDGGFVDLFQTRVVQTQMLSVETSFVNRDGIDCITVDDSEAMDFVEASDDVDVLTDADPANVVEGEDSMLMEVEDDLKRENVLSAGDFIWGKIKNHPWWPGQIHDPSDASESAAKHDPKGRFLVAFSDGSFAWCHSSQLKPFEEDFEEMSKQSNSKNFISAVDNALSDIGKLVELEMTCGCVLKENEGELSRPLADNTGIKEGVLIPERGCKRSITEFEPVEFVANLKNVARGSLVSVVDVLMLKSRLCAFYRAKGGYHLPEYYEPQEIPGLEDKMEDGAVEVPVLSPFEEEMLHSRGAFGYGESSLTGFPNIPGSPENQLHQRKKKSVAENIAKAGTGEVVTENGAKRRRRKKKEDCISSDSGGVVTENGAKRRGRKKKGDYISSDSGEEVTTETMVGIEKGYASRVRKKSKYLSPPYTDLFQVPQKEGSDTESEQLVSVAEMGVEHGSLNSSRPDPMTIELPVKDVLSEIRSVALFASHPDEKTNDSVVEFLFMYRSSTYLEGSHHVYEQQPGEGTKRVSSPKRQGRKRKSICSKDGLLENQNGHIEPQGRSSPGSASLFVTFGPGSSLPTKEELIALYKNFGDLVENETDVFYNSFCACVVFVKTSDAEKAFKSSQESSPFGAANVTFRLRNNLTETKIPPKASYSPTGGSKPPP